MLTIALVRVVFRPCVEDPSPTDDTVVGIGDPFMVLADYRAYVSCQEAAAAAFTDREAWVRKSIRNVARMGWFSSDRAVQEYARDTWGKTGR